MREDDQFDEWAAEIAKLLGLKNIDGCYETDGYSIEEARGLYENRENAHNVAYFFRIRMNEIAKTKAI